MTLAHGSTCATPPTFARVSTNSSRAPSDSMMYLWLTPFVLVKDLRPTHSELSDVSGGQLRDRHLPARARAPGPHQHPRVCPPRLQFQVPASGQGGAKWDRDDACRGTSVADCRGRGDGVTCVHVCAASRYMSVRAWAVSCVIAYRQGCTEVVPTSRPREAPPRADATKRRAEVLGLTVETGPGGNFARSS